MKKKIRIFLCCALALAAPHAVFSRQMPESIIKVGLLVQVPSFNMSCAGACYLYELSTGNQKNITPLDDMIVRGFDNSIIIEGAMLSSPVRIVPGKEGQGIRINGRRYRDSILISIQNGKLTVVNELGIEDYLRGILKMEADPNWPTEALKVQAVISRTYVLRNLRKHGKDGFDVCARTHCQVYGGMDAEDEVCTKAVEDTRGEVLTFNGEMAETLFHASCGGCTEDPNDIWKWEQASPSYLCGVKDPYCKTSPHNSWAKTLSAESIAGRLNAAGYKAGSIKSIKLSGTTGSGRVRNIVIRHSEGMLELSAAKFRLAVGADSIKSTYIRHLDKEGAAYRFEGRGWGHGVGLCQCGASEMAAEGNDYHEILSFYYPGTVVERWDE